MGRLLFLFAVLALACGTPPDNPGVEAPVDTLRIAVYNIHHGAGMDEVIDLERIAALISEQNPDLVALQEIDRVVERTNGVDQAAELGRLTGLTPTFGAFMEYQGGEYGMAVLSKWPVVSSTNHRLPDGDEPRSGLEIRVQSPRTGRQLRFVGLHLYRTEEERLAQANAIISATEESDVPVILAGDFNSEPGTAVMARFAALFTILDKGDDNFTFPSWGAEREIDYVLVRPQDPIEVSQHVVLDEPVASDHRPLFAEIIWR